MTMAEVQAKAAERILPGCILTTATGVAASTREEQHGVLERPPP